LRTGRASAANEAMSSTIGVSSRLWTYANELPVSGSAHPSVPPRPMWPNPLSSPETGDP
jgi:hypothetical protein